MKDGFIKVAALTPKIRVADCDYNAAKICLMIDKAWKEGAKLMVFPELCITGYTCADLFWQEALLKEAKHAAVPYHDAFQGKGRIDLCGTSLGKGRQAL